MSIKTNKKPISAKKFQELLLAWFDKNGRKTLPWQINKSPYKVWVSEIMLQQTQVVTVLPYFQKFIAKFPNVFDLAAAHQDDVLHLWTGLGYYSRAHNLHACSKIIAQEYAGVFPNDIVALQKLPGIGKSTASAIVSLAFDKPATILDGNVKRVFTRLLGIEQAINQKNVETLLWVYAEYYSPLKNCSDYTQAIMDLGATVCLPQKPKCDVCPFMNYCVAYKKGLQHLIPMKITKRKLPIKKSTFLLLKQSHEILLMKRPDFGIWRGLWAFPEIDGEPCGNAITNFALNHLGYKVKNYDCLPCFKHSFSHFHLQIHPVLITESTKIGKMMEDIQQIWYNLKHPKKIGLPKPILHILEMLNEQDYFLPKITKRRAGIT